MRKFLTKYPVIYLLFFCLLALVAGIESGDLIKNGLPEHNGTAYLKIFGILINVILSFYFLSAFIKIKNKRKPKAIL
ncbi:hypothetical protein HX001_02135 [Empedobacter brevis]|uniref:Uncharacterized protein n=1 Tax=Empedobacter brevis TaxID=247 RepID=A0AAJ1V7Y0_9FLAO|nr:hypothetical protein [Empedobacter brevis]MDM1071285.1 hypothetical protein [Empedobacter brevis]